MIRSNTRTMDDTRRALNQTSEELASIKDGIPDIACGQATMSSSSATVADAGVKADSRIVMAWAESTGSGYYTLYIHSITPGVGFVVKCEASYCNKKFNWIRMNP